MHSGQLGKIVPNQLAIAGKKVRVENPTIVAECHQISYLSEGIWADYSIELRACLASEPKP